MANTHVITAKGLNILQSSPANGEVEYFIGYYGLAYVPDRSVDVISQGMTQLTTTGDHIYNVWQGSMVPEGFSENTGAYDLYNNSLYTSNILSRYRYVIDKNGDNNLVMWRDSTDGETKMVGSAVYRGVSSAEGRTESEMPVPAPLFYLGEPVSYAAAPTAENLHASMYESVSSGKYDYPTQEVDGALIPRVSTDSRSYGLSKSGMDNVPSSDTGFTDIGGISAVGGSKYEWASASKTYTQMGDASRDSQITYDFNKTCRQYWKLQSISNYNRFHAPASADGNLVAREPSCRNMSKVTKFFPIANYNVTDAEEGVVSGLKVEINLDLRNYDTQTALNTIDYEQSPEDSGIKSHDGTTDLYKMRNSSFKFNRIGLYAVPVEVHKFYTTDTDDGMCTKYDLQFQINGNAEPVLFAVVDLDTEIQVSDNGDMAQYKYTIAINMGNSDASEGSLVRDAAIYYNLYEDSATTWYKNQLIATASTNEAITAIGLEVGYLKQAIANGVQSANGCSSSTIGDDIYALKNHTHDYMRNLVDSLGEGGVRGLNTIEEGSVVEEVRFSPEQQAFGMYAITERGAGNGIVKYVETNSAYIQTDKVDKREVYIRMAPAHNLIGE